MIALDVGGDEEDVDEAVGGLDEMDLLAVKPPLGAMAIGAASTLLYAG